jgi:hypothetical protein
MPKLDEGLVYGQIKVAFEGPYIGDIHVWLELFVKYSSRPEAVDDE